MNSSSSRKRIAADSVLPDDCWELVISKSLNEIDNIDHRNRYLQTFSFVSKQLLSVSSRFVYSLTISNPSTSLSRIFHRFPNLTSLDLSCFRGDLNALLAPIPASLSLSNFTSLNLSNHLSFPALGLQTIVQKTKLPLTSLICSNFGSPLDHNDIAFVADSFPLLEHFDIRIPKERITVVDDDINCCNNAMKVLTQKLSKLRKVNLSGNLYINDSLFFQLCRNCELLEEVVLLDCSFLTHAGIASAICQRPSLNSLSVCNFMEAREKKNVTSYFIDSLASLKRLTHLDLSFSCVTDDMLTSVANEALPLRNLVLQDCCKYTYFGISYFLSKCRFVHHLDLQNAKFLNDYCFKALTVFLGDLVSINVSGCDSLTNLSFFGLLKSCPLLTEIRMESTQIGTGPLLDLGVYRQVKSLHLANNSWLKNGNIKMFAFMFPNMQFLDLSFCSGISKGIAKVLKRCRNIRHLNLAFCPHAKLPNFNFEAPKLEVLNLSHSGIDDGVLYAISKMCPQLQQLDLQRCYDVTEKGVRPVVENCTRLREINLQYCRRVSTNVVAWMIFWRPSLRKITAPPHFCPCDYDRKLFLRQCLVC